MLGITAQAMTGVGTTTPSRLTSPITALCNEISPDHRPQYVSVLPEDDAQVGACFKNVVDKVARDGGKIVHGWAIWEWPKVFVEAEHHAVWSDGLNLIDVTPHASGETEILFLPDPERVFDFKSPQRLVNVKRSLGVLREAQIWIDANDRLQRVIAQRPETSEARLDAFGLMGIMRDASLTQLNLMVALAKKTGGNEACICGTTRKFKKCCAPQYRLRA